ncbi:ribosome small subunit-dependent GTPase A [Anaerovibrio lipolyticus]|uniref:ribosome small subunit-dependent GTPase A n=1 Tax=Anaerovibrio lipolyticus TaxID=82374 RepID=UPI001F29D7DA|nr:ribosome small subunit-dependent GTPase A [Anaerovibrio lipolyticus]MCF2600770.1 ribosome small subunit-dependent GTPase A [Anaerovibrio lipolyticus]
MPTAQVIKMYNGFYYLQVAGQEELLSCRLRGRIKRNKGAVVTGDYVEYQMLEDGTGVIERCLPRRTLLKRPAVANIDQVLITFAARQPDLNQLLLNRFLVLAEWSGIPEIVICINKCDLLEEKADFLQDYVQAGYKLLMVSAQEGQGIQKLKNLLTGRVTVFAGPSGVGKSSLLNAVDSNLELVTGKISDKIKRGKHTTRAACLLPLPEGGTVVDTPGFSAAELENIDKAQLAHYFPEFRPYIEKCYYNTCTHSHEPDCAVKEAVAAGAICQARYEAYLNILQTINERKKAY